MHSREQTPFILGVKDGGRGGALHKTRFEQPKKNKRDKREQADLGRMGEGVSSGDLAKDKRRQPPNLLFISARKKSEIT